MKGKTKQEKAITLIALIITIVVLLILAAVAISSIVNEDLIAHTENAATKYNGSVTNEQGTLVGYENYLNKHVGGVVGDEVTMLNGDGQTYHTMAPSTLSFRSSADINDFQEVQINGVTLDQSNYTVTEGSTIINLSIDYLKTLEEADYNISIVSKNGSTNAEFSVVEPDLNDHGFYYNQPYSTFIEAFGGTVAFFLREDNSIDVAIMGYTYLEYADSGTFAKNENTIVVNLSNSTYKCTISNDGKEMYCAELLSTFKLSDNSIVADEDYVYGYSQGFGGYVVTTINPAKKIYNPIRDGVNGFPTVFIEDFMFANNVNMTEAPSIPSNITQIGNCAFENCVNLKKVVLPKSIVDINNRVFAGCTSLESIEFEGTIEQWNAISMSGGDSLGNVTKVVCSDGTITL